MKDSDAVGEMRRGSHAHEPAIQVVCLGSGGGPNEDNVTGFLVRSTASKWAKGSLLAVDAGSHLSAITRILEPDFPLVASHTPFLKKPTRNGPIADDDTLSPGDKPLGVDAELSDDSDDASSRSITPEEPPTTILEEGPFAGLPFPHASARANAAHLVREHVSTYLITHPHLDHLSGFVINTAAFHNTSRPKRLAALPFTVNSIKTHIFNDVIWPNLTDEDGGVGFVTFQRLAEGGNIALGEGGARGYIEVCDGLSVRAFKVSHGHCMRGTGHVHRGSNANLPEGLSGASQHHPGQGANGTTGTDYTHEARSLSFSIPGSQPGTPLFNPNNPHNRQNSVIDSEVQQCVIDSTAFFLRTEMSNISTSSNPGSSPSSCREILIFGDVEPDSLSLSPRTAHVWAEAAPKIAQNILRGIFIECSYRDSQGDAVLFGHLAPRHLIDELCNLAEMVKSAKREFEKERSARKRKRRSDGGLIPGYDNSERRTSRTRLSGPSHLNLGGSGPSMSMSSLPSNNSTGVGAMTSGFSMAVGTGTAPPTHDRSDPMETAGAPFPGGPVGLKNPSHSIQSEDHAMKDHMPSPALPSTPGPQTPGLSASFATSEPPKGPLAGVKIVVIHVKDTLADGPLVGEGILMELRLHEARLAKEGRGLGCEFLVSKSGGSYWF